MLDSQAVDDIAVVVAADREDHARSIFEAAGLAGQVRFVHGSQERADSVWAGLQSIADDDGIVLVHDAARALTPPAMIARVVDAVRAVPRQPSQCSQSPIPSSASTAHKLSIPQTAPRCARCKPRKPSTLPPCARRMTGISPAKSARLSQPMMPA